jgi:hypothetical protein
MVLVLPDLILASTSSTVYSSSGVSYCFRSRALESWTASSSSVCELESRSRYPVCVGASAPGIHQIHLLVGGWMGAAEDVF